MTPTDFLIMMAGFFIAGHLVFGPRWIPDGTRGIVAAYVDLWRRVRR